MPPDLVQPRFLSIPDEYDPNRTLGPHVAAVATLAGFPPDPEQRLLLDVSFALDKRGRPLIFETVIVAPRQNLKALAADTPILTAAGWKSMATIEVGDEVYHPDGHMVAVVGVSTPEFGQVCYRVTTTDGRSVVADAGHLWSVADRLSERARIVTTQEMFDAGVHRSSGRTRVVVTDGVRYETVEYRFQLPRQRALKTPDVPLPVAPYLLGAWLGDGHSSGAELSTHEDDVPHWVAEAERAGFATSVRRDRTCYQVGVKATPGRGRLSRTFVGALRQLGVLGNKHVPDAYLAAGTEQREALLQGLMDTDGTIHHRSGQCTFTSTARPLGDAVEYLARSLGWRARMTEGRALLNGRDCGPKYTVTFTPKTEDGYRPFRLARKAQRVRNGDGGRRGRFTVSVKSIEQVSSVPVRCIKVDSGDGLYLAGRGLVATHNTGFLKQRSLGKLFVLKRKLVVWSAHEFDTSSRALDDLEALIDGSDELRRQVQITARGNVAKRGAVPEIRLLPKFGGAKLVFKTRTAGGGAGLTGDDLFIDEAWAAQAGQMGVIMPIMLARPLSQIDFCSSACRPESAYLWELVQRGRAGGGPRMLYAEWCAPPAAEVCDAGEVCQHGREAAGCGCDKPEVIVLAHPAVTRGRIELQKVADLRRTMPVDEFPREIMGWHDEPVQGVAPWTREQWFGCEDPASKIVGRPAIAFDVRPDLSGAVVAAGGQRSDGRGHGELVPCKLGGSVFVGAGTAWLLDRVVEVYDRNDACVLVVDPSGPAGAFEKELLSEERGFVKAPPDEPVPVGKRRLHLVTAREYAQACGALTSDVKNDQWRHLGQAPLNDSADGVRKKALVDAFKWDRADSTADIGPTVAVTLARAGYGLYGNARDLTPMFEWA